MALQYQAPIMGFMTPSGIESTTLTFFFTEMRQNKQANVKKLKIQSER